MLISSAVAINPLAQATYVATRTPADSTLSLTCCRDIEHGEATTFFTFGVEKGGPSHNCNRLRKCNSRTSSVKCNEMPDPSGCFPLVTL